MRAFLPAGLLALALGLFAGVATQARADDFEAAVLAKLNQVRAHPQAYAGELRRAEITAARYGDDARGIGQEDTDAIEDAIGFLMRQAPLPALSMDGRLADVARHYVQIQGPTGRVGHTAPGGSLDRRLQGQPIWASMIAESISYGQPTPADVVRQLVVDSSVPDRGHRLDIFRGVFKAVGVACGPHAQWGSMCVIEYASGLRR